MKIVLNGCFDFLHGGHIGFIRRASELGDVFIILNNDEVVREKGRPVFLPQDERKYILENIKGVSQVIIAEDSYENNATSVGKILKALMPDMVGIVENPEKGDELIPICESLGIKVVRLSRTNSTSSSEIVRRFYDSIKNSSQD